MRWTQNVKLLHIFLQFRTNKPLHFNCESVNLNLFADPSKLSGEFLINDDNCKSKLEILLKAISCQEDAEDLEQVLKLVSESLKPKTLHRPKVEYELVISVQYVTDIKKPYNCKITEKLSTKEIRDGCAMRGFEVTPLCLIINFTIPFGFSKYFFFPPLPHLRMWPHRPLPTFLDQAQASLEELLSNQ